jgi:hypothetical protein
MCAGLLAIVTEPFAAVSVTGKLCPAVFDSVAAGVVLQAAVRMANSNKYAGFLIAPPPISEDAMEA